VKNTSANNFRVPAGLDYYILLAGRWFRSRSLDKGPSEWSSWEPAEDFAKIPEDSPKSGELASVRESPAAQEALIVNSIPQTATITRNEAHLNVEYDGEPQFKNIEGTELQYAVTTATPVEFRNRLEHHAGHRLRLRLWLLISTFILYYYISWVSA
jgi:hypothetical protein